ncbi:MAG: DUF4430 domain-containing protein [Clostridia bacterium]|nr:DUF4430 domain-containing protein [Clostridia bacterium]
MKKLFKFKSIICLLLILVIAAGIALPASAYASQSSKLFSLFASEGGTLQGFIDNTLVKEAGSSYGDWLFIDLMRHDASLNGDKYIAALDEYLVANEPKNNTEKERVAIAYTAAGVSNEFVNSTLEADFSATGINGIIFGLILLDCGGYDSARNDRNTLIKAILDSQLQDNGWSLFGAVSDVDVTSMALQALAPYKARTDVASAIDRALSMLSEKQTDDGDFKSMMGMGRPPMPTCESTAQVIVALTALGIDPAKNTAFIKNGNTVYDGLRRYQLSDGSYCHTTGTGRNAIATEQAARALVAAERFSTGKSPYFSFKKPVKPDPEPPVVTPDDPADSSSGETLGSSENTETPDSSSSDASSDESSSASSEDGAGVSSLSSSIDSASEMSSGSETAAPSNKSAYKFYVCGAIGLLFAAVCVILAIKKKASLKNVIPIAVVAILLICGVLLLNFTSVKDYYSVNLSSAGEGDNTVTISISCRILEGVEENIPEDGYILKPTKYVINEGDTVFDALLAVTRANQIKINYTGNAGGVLSVYVSSIAGFSEMQYGALSGWIYRVNNYTPDVGCGSYDIKDGDVIEWVYTLDLGKDAENG